MPSLLGDDDSPTTAPESGPEQSSDQESHEQEYTHMQSLLENRQRLTAALHDLPYDILLYVERATVHADLGYPDLAAGDAYRALLLADEVREESFEYHDFACEALKGRIEEGDWGQVLGRRGSETTNIAERREDDEDENAVLLRLAARASIRCYQILSISLLLCGCLKSSYEFCMRGLATKPRDEELLHTQEDIHNLVRRRLKLSDSNAAFDINDLPDQGLVRREIYPWNDFEPDRFSQETLDFLNSELASAAPKCEVRAVSLPTLLDSTIAPSATNLQLGLFAKSDIYAGEIVLDEFSILTANNRLKASLCDACSCSLPPLDAEIQAIPCPSCDDTMFCSEACFSASLLYHPAVCDKDIDTIAKDPDPKETPNALYLLLLARSFAMATSQEVHPLGLKETQYIYGDFLPTTANAVPISPTAGPPPVWTLPFSFAANIAGPLHVLEKMDLDIFEIGVEDFDTWVVNTLYAKFRGTASARVGLRDGRPEVAAVHPLWCLANHDCAPNVGWEWGGRMRFICRQGRGLPFVAPDAEREIEGERRERAADRDAERVDGEEIRRSGSVDPRARKVVIPADSEILSHYCDIELPVRERREWAKGSLGGWCMCARCVREEEEEKMKDKSRESEEQKKAEQEQTDNDERSAQLNEKNSSRPVGVDVDVDLIIKGMVDGQRLRN